MLFLEDSFRQLSMGHFQEEEKIESE